MWQEDGFRLLAMRNGPLTIWGKNETETLKTEIKSAVFDAIRTRLLPRNGGRKQEMSY